MLLNSELTEVILQEMFTHLDSILEYLTSILYIKN